MKKIFNFLAKLFSKGILKYEKSNRNYLIFNGIGEGKSHQNIIVSKR